MAHSPQFFARHEGIFAEEIRQEILIYDTHTDLGHALSATAAVVWRTCESGATLDEIAEQLLAAGLADSGDAAVELADMAVAELIEKRLLDTSGTEASAVVSRRQALRTLGGASAAAVLGPLIVSAAIPSSAAAAGSCVGLLGTCTVTGMGPMATNNCCNGLNCQALGMPPSGGTKCCYGPMMTTPACSDCCSGHCMGMSTTTCM